MSSKNKDRLFDEFSATSYEDWKKEAIKLLKGKEFDRTLFTNTAEGIILEPLYNKNDFDKLKHTSSLPGTFPYIRGTKVEGDIIKPWIVAQSIYAPNSKDFNKILLEDLERGLTAISFKLDAPTLLGYDADDSSAYDISYKGLSISTLEDIEISLKDVEVESIPFILNAGENPIPIISLIASYFNKKGYDLSKLSGTIGYDPISFASKEGKLKFSLKTAYDIMASTIEWAKSNNSQIRTILVSTNVYHDAGADSVSELTYSMATAAEYIKEMLDRGFNIEDISKRLSFSVSVGSNFFMEISKLRAIKVLYANLIKSFGGSDEASKIYLHAKTSSFTKTIYDPYVNMLRNASEAFSAAVGVVDSLDVVPFDEAIRPADNFSRRVSRNVQYFLQDEARISSTIDPSGGSWYVETLTENIINSVWENFSSILANNNMSDYVKKGNVKKEILDKYEELFKSTAKRKNVIVGINMYVDVNEVKLNCNFDENISLERIENLKFQRKSIKKGKLDNYKLKTKENLDINYSIKCIESGVTLGELSKVFFENSNYTVPKIKSNRASKRFEDLRDNTKILKKEGRQPKVFLANIGKLAQYKPRADFSRGFFEVAEFDVIDGKGFLTALEAAEAAIKSKANITVICSTDAIYPNFVPEITRLIKKNSKMRVFVAGRAPSELVEEYKDAGVDSYIYMGANCYNILKEIQEEVL